MPSDQVIVIDARHGETPEDSLRRALPASCWSIMSQFGALFSREDEQGVRALDEVWARRYAALLAEKNNYSVDAVLAVLSKALADWNKANTAEGADPVPVP